MPVPEQKVFSVYGPINATPVSTAPTTRVTIQTKVNEIPNNTDQQQLSLHGLQRHVVPVIPTIMAVDENAIKIPNIISFHCLTMSLKSPKSAFSMVYPR